MCGPLARDAGVWVVAAAGVVDEADFWEVEAWEVEEAERERALLFLRGREGKGERERSDE